MLIFLKFVCFKHFELSFCFLKKESPKNLNLLYYFNKNNNFNKNNDFNNNFNKNNNFNYFIID